MGARGAGTDRQNSALNLSELGVRLRAGAPVSGWGWLGQMEVTFIDPPPGGWLQLGGTSMGNYKILSLDEGIALSQEVFWMETIWLQKNRLFS